MDVQRLATMTAVDVFHVEEAPVIVKRLIPGAIRLASSRLRV